MAVTSPSELKLREQCFCYLAGRILYSFGRVVIYTLMGAIFGLIGYGFYFSGIVQAVIISIGILLLVSALPLPGR